MNQEAKVPLLYVLMIVVVLIITNGFWFILAKSYAEDTAGYNYAVSYMADELLCNKIIYVDNMGDAYQFVNEERK